MHKRLAMENSASPQQRGITIHRQGSEIGEDDPASASQRSNMRFFVKFIADVKGSPMDAEAECDFTVKI